MLLVQARRLIWIAILCVGFASISTVCVAAVGTITEQANNPASIQRAKSTLTGTKGVGVEMEDAVKTSQGKVGITFADNTKVQVNENSKLVIDDFVYDPKKRHIHKAIVRDRILHQAVFRILYPIFNKHFIFDSYSSRVQSNIIFGVA